MSDPCTIFLLFCYSVRWSCNVLLSYIKSCDHVSSFHSTDVQAYASTTKFQTFTLFSANDITESGGDIEWQYFDERSYIDAKKVQDGEDAYSRNKFNQAASDKLASNRVIPDTRSTQCKARQWPHEDLPETSVIITFHNEARSTLLRTIVR